MPLPKPLHPIQLVRRRRLRPRPLPPNRQTLLMSPTPITAHVHQPPNVVPHVAAQVVLDAHLGQLGVQVEDVLVVEEGDFGGGVDVEFRH